jgi:hypothetical protein
MFEQLLSFPVEAALVIGNGGLLLTGLVVRIRRRRRQRLTIDVGRLDRLRRVGA